MNQLTKELERLEARDKDELIAELEKRVEVLETENSILRNLLEDVYQDLGKGEVTPETYTHILQERKNPRHPIRKPQ